MTEAVIPMQEDLLDAEQQGLALGVHVSYCHLTSLHAKGQADMHL